MRFLYTFPPHLTPGKTQTKGTASFPIQKRHTSTKRAPTPRRGLHISSTAQQSWGVSFSKKKTKRLERRPCSSRFFFRTITWETSLSSWEPRRTRRNIVRRSRNPRLRICRRLGGRKRRPWALRWPGQRRGPA